MYVCRLTQMQMLSDTLWELGFFFSTVCILRGWVQVVRLGNKRFDPGSHPFLSETFLR